MEDDQTEKRQPSPVGYIMSSLRKYAVFSGRARRKEYWYFRLFQALAVFVPFCVWLAAYIFSVRAQYAGDSQSAEGLSDIAIAAYWLMWVGGFWLLVLPTLAVGVRRIHDTGRSGWWLWLFLIPIIGWIVWLVIDTSDSQPGTNAYGPNPKGYATVPNPQAVATAASPRGATTDSAAYCAHCGARAAANARYCRECGKHLDLTRRPGQSAWPWIVSLALLAAIVVIGYVHLERSGSQAPQPQTTTGGTPASTTVSSTPASVAQAAASPIDVVREYYQFWNEKNYAAMYGLLSMHLQQIYPYSTYPHRHSFTDSITVDATTGASPSVVSFNLYSTDHDERGNISHSRFYGTWYLIWEQGAWKLNAQVIHEIPSGSDASDTQQ